MFLVEVGEESYFFGSGRPGEEAAEGESDFLCNAAGGGFEKFAIAFGDLDEHGVIHEGEGLEGSVGAVASGQAGFTGTSVEGGEHREGGGALLINVDRAAETVLASAGAPFRSAIGHLADASGLRRADGWSKHPGVEKSRCLQGGVADDLGFETLPDKLL